MAAEFLEELLAMAGRGIQNHDSSRRCRRQAAVRVLMPYLYKPEVMARIFQETISRMPEQRGIGTIYKVSLP